jgi:hypothetical protein
MLPADQGMIMCMQIFACPLLLLPVLLCLGRLLARLAFCKLHIKVVGPQKIAHLGTDRCLASQVAVAGSQRRGTAVLATNQNDSDMQYVTNISLQQILASKPMDAMSWAFLTRFKSPAVTWGSS